MSLLEQTLQMANTLLMRYCIPRIVYQISDCDSITFIALFESITHSAVPSVNRLPSLPQEHVDNYIIILSQISVFLPQDINLDHIDPTALSTHDSISIHNLLELMSVLGEILIENSSPQYDNTPSPLFADPPMYPDIIPGFSQESAGIPMTSYTNLNADELSLDRFQEKMERLHVTDDRYMTTQSPKTFQLLTDVATPDMRTNGLSHHTSLESIEILSLPSSHYGEQDSADERPLSPLPPFHDVDIQSLADTQEVPQISITELEHTNNTTQSPIPYPPVVILNRRNEGTGPLIPLNSVPLQRILTSDSDIYPRPEPIPRPFSPPRILSNMDSPNLEINSILISEDSLAIETDPNKTLTPQRTPHSMSKKKYKTEDLARMDSDNYCIVKDVHHGIFAPLTKPGITHKSPYSVPVIQKGNSKTLVRTPSKPLKSPGKLQRSSNKKDKVQFSQSTQFRDQIREIGKELLTNLNDTIQVGEKGIEAERRAEANNATVRRDILKHMYSQYMKDKKHEHKNSKKENKSNRKKQCEEFYDITNTSSTQDYVTEYDISNYDPPQDRVTRTDDNLFPMIKREFPYMELSPTASRRLWNKQIHQIESLTKSAKPTQTKQYRELLEAEKRQISTIDILNKDLQHARRVRDMQAKAHSEQLMKSQLRDRRTAQAKSKQYYKEYELRMKSRLQKKRTKEEVVFQKIFEDALDIQKERVKELRHFAREKQAVEMQAQQDSLQSLENYYKDRFTMLTEKITRETRDETKRKRNENIETKKMRREGRQRLEQEIQKLQDHIDDVENDTHFRELDAVKFRDSLRAATFLAPIK
ncbi:Centrosomal protein of 95 kDa-like [Oopsacas minuta]|uniref:Centrosomal protein of 95 kDa-like n=1 Tax=Oopsacas minuta TaxID=111878 RepID=A0AAV7JM28_9METZ|nr:Centrosomal protein of 95 kDa-like [Oopsacas minuta]